MSEAVFRRGDVVICALSGDGKSRPAVVVQSDLFNETHDSVVVCPITSELTGLTMFRLPLAPAASTGLHLNSEIMIDKISAIARKRIRQTVGRISRSQMVSIDDALRLWMELPRSKEHS